MEGYLGEVDITDTLDPEDLSPKKIALLYIEMYGGIDGAHHKDWVLDQVVRILNGAPVTVKRASWSNGHSELRYDVGDSEEYRQWVAQTKAGEDGPDTYSYSEGIAP